MSEQTVEMTDFDRLTQELRKQPGATEHAVKLVTEGIEIEAFMATPAGKVIVGGSLRGMVTHLEFILDPNVGGEELLNAVHELRSRHRVLMIIEEAVASGKAAAQRLTSLSDTYDEDNL